jgi:siroheme synthase-like protein
MYYPIYLNLKNRRLVVVGGGSVAERKVVSLLDSGASVVVVSPRVTKRLAALAASGSIQWVRRAYAPGDCRGAFAIFSAAGDPAVGKAVFAEGGERGALVNTADEPGLCDFIMPAVVRRGDLTIAISTAGASPALAAGLRRRLSRLFGAEYAGLLSLLSRVRPEIRRRVRSVAGRKEVHYRILRSDALELLRKRDSRGAERRVREIIDDFTLREKLR